MTITIPDSVQYTRPADGFAGREFTSVSVQRQGVTGTTFTVATTDLSITGSAAYTDGTSDASILLVPALRPFHCAALHVVGSDFANAIPIDKVGIRRFM